MQCYNLQTVMTAAYVKSQFKICTIAPVVLMTLQVDALATFTANCGLQQDFRNNAGHWTAVGRLEVSTS